MKLNRRQLRQFIMKEMKLLSELNLPPSGRRSNQDIISTALNKDFWKALDDKVAQVNEDLISGVNLEVVADYRDSVELSSWERSKGIKSKPERMWNAEDRLLKSKGTFDDDEKEVHRVFIGVESIATASRIADDFYRENGIELFDYLKSFLSDSEMKTYVYDPLRTEKWCDLRIEGPNIRSTKPSYTVHIYKLEDLYGQYYVAHHKNRLTSRMKVTGGPQ